MYQLRRDVLKENCVTQDIHSVRVSITTNCKSLIPSKTYFLTCVDSLWTDEEISSTSPMKKPKGINRDRAWVVKRDRVWTDNTTIIDTNHEETEGDQQIHRTWSVKRKRYLIRYPTKSQSSVDTPLSNQIQNSVDVPLPHQLQNSQCWSPCPTKL
jgi:hypothetical protein